MIDVARIVEYQSLETAKLLAGRKGLNNEVTGIMVLESIDIEHWGKPGDILLSSYFALTNLSDREMDEFFFKLKKYGIAALIIKLDRLIEAIPEKIKENCDKYNIPLLQINKNIKYKKVIIEVLSSIINQKAFLLDRFYDIHNMNAKMALSQPSLLDIIFNLKKIMNRPITIQNKKKGDIYSTDRQLENFIVEEIYPIQKEDLKAYDYQRRMVYYAEYQPTKPFSQIMVSVPYLGYGNYQLIVHELDHYIHEFDFMALESTISFLQGELHREYSISQNEIGKRNEIILNLIEGKTFTQESVLEQGNYLNLSSRDQLRLISFNLVNLDLSNNEMLKIYKDFFMHSMNFIKNQWENPVFLQQAVKLIVILPMQNYQKENHFTIKNELENLLHSSLELKKFKDIKINISISECFNIFSLSSANKQLEHLQKILNLAGKTNTVFSYNDLGIYKIFLETNSLDKIENFIPSTLKIIFSTYPEWLHTLRIFLDTKNSYKETAEKLYIHPKTVRYRIQKITELVDNDFSDPEEVLQFSIGLRLLELTR